jgi:threonine aldolase
VPRKYFWATMLVALTDQLTGFLRERGILIAGRESIRLVTHRDVSADDIEAVVSAFADFFAGN